jgi:hypothetical protein
MGYDPFLHLRVEFDGTITCSEQFGSINYIFQANDLNEYARILEQIRAYHTEISFSILLIPDECKIYLRLK